MALVRTAATLGITMVVLVGASPAFAGSVSRSGDKLLYMGGGQNNRIHADITAANELRLSDTSGNAIRANDGSGCRRGSRKSIALCSRGGINWIEAHLGGGKDAFYNETDINSMLFGETGNDDRTVGLGTNSQGFSQGVLGLIGGSGFDVVDGGPGADFVGDRGGDPARSVWGVQNSLVGGNGRDLITNGFFFYAGFIPLFVPSDATTAMSGGADADSLLGDNGVEVMDGGPGPDRLTAGGGNDRLNGLDGVKDKLIDCGEGFDLVRRDVFDPIAACEQPF